MKKSNNYSNNTNNTTTSANAAMAAANGVNANVNLNVDIAAIVAEVVTRLQTVQSSALVQVSTPVQSETTPESAPETVKPKQTRKTVNRLPVDGSIVFNPNIRYAPDIESAYAEFQRELGGRNIIDFSMFNSPEGFEDDVFSIGDVCNNDCYSTYESKNIRLLKSSSKLTFCKYNEYKITDILVKNINALYLTKTHAANRIEYYQLDFKATENDISMFYTAHLAVSCRNSTQ